jgi:phosphate transport system substrate-binding protein
VRRYVRRVALLAALAVPALAQLGTCVVIIPIVSGIPLLGEFAAGAIEVLSIILVVVFSASVWLFFYPRGVDKQLPASLFVRLAPAVIPPMFYLLAWIVVLLLADFSYVNGFWVLYCALSAPWLPVNVALFVLRLMSWVVLLQVGQAIIAVVMIQLLARRNRRLRREEGRDAGGTRLDKRALVTGGVLLAVCLAAVFCLGLRSQRYVATQDFDQMVGSEVSLGNYRPFGRGNDLAVLPTPDLVIESDYPRLDGATAALPVYGAMAQAIYRGLDDQSAYDYVNCSTTSEAYEQLIYGRVDLFFGAQPSGSQVQLAEQVGVKLELTPLGREAFVLFVNKDNPVDSLTLEQIRDIYQKKITNWTQVGGADMPIIAYQRNEGSGSQTIMEARVMGDEQMATPLRHESVSFMGGMVNEVAEYENGASALGYSFRYYVTGMEQNDDVKLLAIEGVAPTVENIRNGSYPFTIDFYAVTAGTQNPHVPELIDWILSEQGQAAIEQCGYVALPEG